jgi:CTP synthase
MMEEQKKIMNKGGTMRLGVYPCRIAKGTLVHEIYQRDDVSERHRHRYEFNNEYLKEYEAAGMIPAGINPRQNLVEIIELKNHPWFIGVQFHPEYRSTVDSPHPLFVGFIGAAIKHKQLRQMAVSH